MQEKQKYSFLVNGNRVSVSAYPFENLLNVLRDELSLIGTKEGCSEGECGACSVFVEGKLVNSCLLPIAQCQDTEIKTIECTKNIRFLGDVQDAFLKYGGAQCGICTPGMILAAVNLLQENDEPSRDEVRTALAGNLCRCTGYMKIFDSVLEAAKEVRKSNHSSGGANEL